MPVSFETTDVDREIIRKITLPAVALGKTLAGDPDPLYVTKAITATHANGCPLDLQRFLEADDLDFAHDLIGIFRHFDCTTAMMRNSF
jgi:hypothetical protein